MVELLRAELEVDVSSIEWEKFGGALITEFDDGHRPETWKDDDERRHTRTKLVNYPQLFDEREAQVCIYANALPEELVDRAYEKTTTNSPYPSWGDYVTIEQVQQYWTGKSSSEKENSDPIENIHHDDLSLLLVAHYLQLALGEGQLKPASRLGDGSHPLWTRNDLAKAHGVAIWGLAAKVGSHVPYHLDYAEQIRYDCNIIVPPLLAGTLQCTRDALIGGDFCVSLEGISHYETYGYKNKKKELPPINCKEQSKDSMIAIPYQFNQLTCHLGNLPHASTEIESIQGDQQVRVIVGFNVFGHDVGPIVARAPEHSDAFRRKVQAQRALLLKQQQQQSFLSLDMIKRNKPLTKLLVLAKRMRIKEEFQKAQALLLDQIDGMLPATVQTLMDALYDPTKHDQDRCFCWPSSPTDIQVFLTKQTRDGRYRIIILTAEEDGSNTTDETNRTNKTLISKSAMIGLPIAKEGASH